MSGKFTLDDPRVNQSDAPYTYFLPLPEHLRAVAAGDLVQLVFRPSQPSKWEAERMWVQVTARDSTAFEGLLVTEPDDMPEVRPGEKVSFEAHHVVSVILADESRYASLPRDERREYWDRCVVDSAVLSGDLLVGYLYREEPDLTEEGDLYPDSGWRIRGDVREAYTSEVEDGEPAYVALGAVLNRDDSWLHLIDQPVGSAFERDFDSGMYNRLPDRSTDRTDDPS